LGIKSKKNKISAKITEKSRYWQKIKESEHLGKKSRKNQDIGTKSQRKIKNLAKIQDTSRSWQEM